MSHFVTKFRQEQSTPKSTGWHSHSWLCSYDPAPTGDPAPRRTETTTNIEKVFASATTARPSSNLIVEGRRPTLVAASLTQKRYNPGYVEKA